MHIQSKLLLQTFVMGASSDLGQPFSSKTKMFGFGLGGESGNLATTFAQKEHYRPV